MPQLDGRRAGQRPGVLARDRGVGEEPQQGPHPLAARALGAVQAQVVADHLVHADRGRVVIGDHTQDLRLGVGEEDVEVEVARDGHDPPSVAAHDINVFAKSSLLNPVLSGSRTAFLPPSSTPMAMHSTSSWARLPSADGNGRVDSDLDRWSRRLVSGGGIRALARPHLRQPAEQGTHACTSIVCPLTRGSRMSARHNLLGDLMEPADHPDVTGRDLFGRGRLSAAASQAARDQTRLQASQQAVASEVIAFQVLQQRTQLASGAEIDRRGSPPRSRLASARSSASSAWGTPTANRRAARFADRPPPGCCGSRRWSRWRPRATARHSTCGSPRVMPASATRPAARRSPRRSTTSCHRRRDRDVSVTDGYRAADRALRRRLRGGRTRSSGWRAGGTDGRARRRRVHR